MFVFKKQHNLPPPNPLHFTVCHKPTNRTFLTIHRDHTSHTRLHEKYSAALLQKNIVNTRPLIQPRWYISGDKILQQDPCWTTQDPLRFLCWTLLSWRCHVPVRINECISMCRTYTNLQLCFRDQQYAFYLTKFYNIVSMLKKKRIPKYRILLQDTKMEIMKTASASCLIKVQ